MMTTLLYMCLCILRTGSLGYKSGKRLSKTHQLHTWSDHITRRKERERKEKIKQIEKSQKRQKSLHINSSIATL